MTIKRKQWQRYYFGYYGGEIDGVWGAGSHVPSIMRMLEVYQTADI